MPAKAVLRKVVHRKPVPFFQHPERKDREYHLGVYCVETLDCGHKQTTYPECDPLIAKYRRCQKCDDLLEVSVPKKPPASVRFKKIHKIA